jgi:hypothetical protein
MFALMAGLAGRVGRAARHRRIVPLIDQLKTSIKQLTDTANNQIGGVGTDVRTLVVQAPAATSTTSPSR